MTHPQASGDAVARIQRMDSVSQEQVEAFREAYAKHGPNLHYLPEFRIRAGLAALSTTPRQPDAVEVAVGNAGLRTAYRIATEAGAEIKGHGPWEEGMRDMAVRIAMRCSAAMQPLRAELAAHPAPVEGQSVTIPYTNWRGEFALRTITPTGRMVFTSNEWHPTPQWLIEAKDEKSGEVRLFALSRIGALEAALSELVTAWTAMKNRAPGAPREPVLGRFETAISAARALSTRERDDGQ